MLADEESDLAHPAARGRRGPAASGAARLRQGRGGRAGAGHRQPVRRRPDGQQRHRLGAGALGRGHRPGPRLFHPDRRADQPRQFRRRADRHERRADRHQHLDPQPLGRIERHRFRDPGQPGRRIPGAGARRCHPVRTPLGGHGRPARRRRSRRLAGAGGARGDRRRRPAPGQPLRAGRCRGGRRDHRCGRPAGELAGRDDLPDVGGRDRPDRPRHPDARRRAGRDRGGDDRRARHPARRRDAPCPRPPCCPA